MAGTCECGNETSGSIKSESFLTALLTSICIPVSFSRRTVLYGVTKSSSQTSRIGPFDPFRLQSYNCSFQRFFGLPIVFLPCGLISKGFGFVAFFASVETSSVCIHLS